MGNKNTERKKRQRARRRAREQADAVAKSTMQMLSKKFVGEGWDTLSEAGDH